MTRTTTDYLAILLAVLEGRNLTDGNSLVLAGHEMDAADVTRLRELVVTSGHAFLASCNACGHDWSDDDEPRECPVCGCESVAMWFKGGGN